MYSERRLVQEIRNYLGYAKGNLQAARKMLRGKRSPFDVYCQLRSAEVNFVENGLKKFDEANRKDLTTRINRLLNRKNLPPESAETLTGIQEQLGQASVKQLLRFEKAVKKIEQLFCWLLFLQTDFLEPLLQNPLWPVL